MISKFYVPAIIWTISILYLSAFPGPQLNIEFDFLTPDKIAHFAAYGLLSVLVGWGYFKTHQKLSNKNLLIILIIGISYGISMEIMQYLFFPNRYFEYGDIFANIIGSFLGLVIIRFYCLNYK